MKRLIYATAAAIVLAGCSTVNYQAYEGQDQVLEGTGGTKQMIGGYEVWDNGQPPRKYRVVGVAEIEDYNNVFGRSRMESALAAKIKEAGGDAAVVLGGWSEGGSSGAFFMPGRRGGMVVGGSDGKKATRYQIIKYLGGAPASTAGHAPSQSQEPKCLGRSAHQAGGVCF